MAFSHFKSVEQVIQHYPLRIRRELFLPDTPVELPEWFLQNLNFALLHQAEDENEFFWRESFIFPFLQRAWQCHGKLKLWSHRGLTCDSQLGGEPDYFVSAWRDEVISQFVTLPLLAVVEAKQQDFEGGWGQCLAELIACQKINQNDQLTIYGIVSTGLIWQFGKLQGNVFTRHPLPYSVTDPQRIFGNLDWVFNECEKQVG